VIDGPPELTEQDRLAAYGKLLTEAVYGTDPVKVRAARRAIVLMVSIARWQGHPSAMPSDRGAADLPEPRVPLVVTVERAADYLGVPAERIAQVAATLDPWGAHASGEPVWRLRELASAASCNVCPVDDGFESLIVGVAVSPGDVPADHARLLAV
jgi:hypothetical protein